MSIAETVRLQELERKVVELERKYEELLALVTAPKEMRAGG